jgi:histidyl-tRNA synthetase
MEQEIAGNKYKFIVKLLDDVYFEVVAIQKSDNKTSSITNLNTIIGEFIYPILGEIEVNETFLEINNLQNAKKLFNFAAVGLNDRGWVSDYLENDLDEDFGLIITV